MGQGWLEDQSGGLSVPGMCCWGPGWRGQWTWRGQVDKKTLRRKTSTSLATAICRRPQHEKGPPPLPLPSVRRSQTLQQRAGQETKCTRMTSRPSPNVLCSALCPLLSKQVDTSHLDRCKGQRTWFAVCMEHAEKPPEQGCLGD